MNLVDAVVVEVKETPIGKFGKWFVKVRVNAYGRESDTELMFNTLAEAESVSVGTKVLV